MLSFLMNYGQSLSVAARSPCHFFKKQIERLKEHEAYECYVVYEVEGIFNTTYYKMEVNIYINSNFSIYFCTYIHVCSCWKNVIEIVWF